MDYLKYVNIKQGTNSVRRFSNGNTLPLVQLPFTMAGYSAQTEYDGGWFYNPTHRSLEGIRLTHQPSPWISDYGTFLFTPHTGEVRNSVGSAWSSYRPEDAVMTPTYMKFRFLRSRTDFELTPAERSCKIRLTYPEGRTPYFTVFPVFKTTVCFAQPTVREELFTRASKPILLFSSNQSLTRRNPTKRTASLFMPHFVTHRLKPILPRHT